jgi:hypothetical protein
MFGAEEFRMARQKVIEGKGERNEIPSDVRGQD